MLLRLLPRLRAAFPDVKIKLRGDAGFALPLLYEFCEFFGIQYALGIPANCVFQHRAEPRRKQLKRRYHRTQLPQARLLQLPPPCPKLVAPAPHLLQGRTHRGRNQPALPRHQLLRPRRRRFRLLQRPRRMPEPHRGVQERLPRRPPELSPLPGQRLPPAAAWLRLQSRQPVSSPATPALALGADRNPARTALPTWRPRPPDRWLHPLPPGQRMALSGVVRRGRARPQQQLTRFLASELDFPQAAAAELCRKIIAATILHVPPRHRAPAIHSPR